MRDQTEPSDPHEPRPLVGDLAPDADAGAGADEALTDAEELDGLPVLDSALPVQPHGIPSRELASPPTPGLQVAAVAATGFLAGAAVAGLLHRRRVRHSALAGRAGRAGRRARRSSGPLDEVVQIVGSRSLLVDVHLLGGRD
jgi:hypothetical protein